MYIIYALIDPRDSQVHYVGMTDDVYKRFIDHIQCSGRNFGKNAWMLSMREANVMVQMVELERIEDLGRARMREVYWINHYGSLGHPITNIQRPAPRLVYKILVRSSGARSPKAAIATIENELQPTAVVKMGEEQVEAETMAMNPLHENGLKQRLPEFSEDGPDLKAGDKRFSVEQEQEFIRRYQRNGQQGIWDIKASLRQMNDGRGLGNAYFTHARYLIEKYQLKKS